MDSASVHALVTNPEYLRLVAQRERFAWFMAAVPTFLLLAFLAGLAWAPGFLGRNVVRVFSVGMLWALAIIGASLIITWAYLRRSERVYDPAQRQLLERLARRS